MKSAGRDLYSWPHLRASHSQEGLVNGADIPLALSKCDGAPPGLFRLALLPVKKRFRGLARCRQLVGRCARFPKRASFTTKHSMVPVDDRPEQHIAACLDGKGAEICRTPWVSILAIQQYLRLYYSVSRAKKAH